MKDYFVKDRFGGLLDPFRDVWGFYQRLDPEQQRSALLLALVGVAAFVVWVAYQVHGDRVVIVLPAWMLRIALLLLVLPFVFLGKVAGRGTVVPRFLMESWTAGPDPEGAKIPSKKVNPMKVAGGLRSKRSDRAHRGRTARKRREDR
jgi:hypothetical protein